MYELMNHTLRGPIPAIAISCLSYWFVGTASAAAGDEVVGDLIQFNDNGAWSWFSEERAIVDQTTGMLLIGSVTESYGAGGRDADAEISFYKVSDGSRGRFVLNSALGPGQGGNDHAHPVLDQLSDGRYIAAYAAHGLDSRSRFRVSINPHDPTSWGPEVTFDNTAPGEGGINGSTTYSNVFQLTGENGRIYNFNRSRGFDPNFNYSDDGGASWQYGGRLLNDNPNDPVNRNNTRPYANYTTNGVDEIHFINTDDHPNNRITGLYHGMIRDGKVYDSFGNEIDGNLFDIHGSLPSAPSRIFQGTTSRSAWGSDIELDASGKPVVVFSTQVNNSASDLRYHYARFDGTQWHESEIAFAGTNALFGQTDYTGNISLDPNDLNTVYISSNVNPTTGQALLSAADGKQHFEIYKGVTADGGQTFTWTAITKNSTNDNLRPIVPEWDADHTALIWMRGRYGIPENPGNYDRGAGFLDYDLAIVGLIEQNATRRGAIDFFDATRANTSRTDGVAWNPTGPSNVAGADDNRWHERTGMGNGGAVFASDESGSETVPGLTMAVSPDEAGHYDSFIYFWANPDEDWAIRAGLSANELRLYRVLGAEQVNPDEFEDTGLVHTHTGNAYLYQAFLGRVELAAGETLNVYLDDLAGEQSASERTMFEGVGLSRVFHASDLNTDGIVGQEDLVILLANWGTSGIAFATGDVNGDGLVNSEDLNRILRDWEESEPPDINVPEPTSMLTIIAGLLLTKRPC